MGQQLPEAALQVTPPVEIPEVAEEVTLASEDDEVSPSPFNSTTPGIPPIAVPRTVRFARGWALFMRSKCQIDYLLKC